METLVPVAQRDRIVFMDVLRGFAILGIFLANLKSGFSWYDESAHHSGPMLLPYLDHKFVFLYDFFLDGKFYSIFSLLFGWGIALQLQRGEHKNIDAVPTIKRRLVFMLFLGAFHLLLWPGDIVFFYAMLGFLLLPMRRFSNKTLLIAGSIFILLPILLYAAKMHWPILNRPAEFLFETGLKVDGALNGTSSQDDFMNLMRHGTWWDVLKADVAGFFFRYGDLFFVSRIWKVLGMFMIGFVVGRSNFYHRVVQKPRILYPFIIGGLAIGIPANYFLATIMMNAPADYYQLKPNGLYRTIAYALGVAPMAIAYAGMLALSFQFPFSRKILGILAPVGKMAFSNYIMHTLIGNFVFLGAGLGYMEQVGPVYFTIFGILVFAAQVLLSSIWLSYFNYGPLEWLWRSGTYGKWQPLRRKQKPVTHKE